MEKIKLAIYGYGNLGKGVEEAILSSNDLELVKVFSRRDGLKTIHNQDIENIKNIDKYSNQIDVLVMCGGSATDLPIQSPKMLEKFCIVDSFDTHAKVPEHFAILDKVAKENNTLAIMSVGWDPGLFSMMRVMFSSFLPQGDDYTFWGRGVSQGHSDAIRRIEGVKHGIQYTVPVVEAINRVRSFERPVFTTRDKHIRECYVVANDGADKNRIESEIVNMKNYFSEYNTNVHFISEEEFKKDHIAMPHGGFVLRSGETHEGKNKYLLELAIKLDSNPEFTGSILASYARAASRMKKRGNIGCYTALDVILSDLSPLSPAELREKML